MPALERGVTVETLPESDPPSPSWQINGDAYRAMYPEDFRKGKDPDCKICRTPVGISDIPSVIVPNVIFSIKRIARIGESLDKKLERGIQRTIRVKRDVPGVLPLVRPTRQAEEQAANKTP